MVVEKIRYGDFKGKKVTCDHCKKSCLYGQLHRLNGDVFGDLVCSSCYFNF